MMPRAAHAEAPPLPHKSPECRDQTAEYAQEKPVPIWNKCPLEDVTTVFPTRMTIK